MWNPLRLFRRSRTDAQAKVIVKALKQDAWNNIYTQLGKKGRDKRTGGRFDYEPVTSVEAQQLWLGDSLAAKVIEVVPHDAGRRGYKVKLDNEQQSKKLHNALRALGADAKFTRAEQMERAYGGCGMFCYSNDGQEISTPLGGSFTMPEHITLFEPRELVPITYYTSAHDENYGMPELYRVMPIATHGAPVSMEVIHASRLIIFPGIRVSREPVLGAEPGWGGNVLTRVQGALRDLNLSWAGAAALIQDFAQAVIKIKGLGRLIDDNNDDAVLDRILQLDLSRSIIRMMVLDGDDEFHREATPVSGLADLLVQFMTWFAALCDMSVVRMFGISPAGLNATGENDIIMGDDKAEGLQQEHMPQRRRMIEMMLQATDGPTNGKVPAEWDAEYNPLRTPSAKEQAETMDLVSASDERWWKMGAVSGDEVAKSRWGSGKFSLDMIIDFKAREQQQLAAPTPMNALPPGSEADPDDPNDPKPPPDEGGNGNGSNGVAKAQA